jgi:hypothetical protein
MEPQEHITVEVLAYAPVAFFHCQHCEIFWQQTGASQHFHREQVASSLPGDLMEEYQQLSEWVREMRAAHGERITFRVIDAASIEGWFKSVRYNLHSYPAVIVNGKEKIIGCSFERATAVIHQRMVSSSR